MDEKRLTPGEILELIAGLKQLGVSRGKVGGLEFEFFMLPPARDDDAVQQHESAEEYEKRAREIRKALNDEVFAAS